VTGSTPRRTCGSQSCTSVFSIPGAAGRAGAGYRRLPALGTVSAAGNRWRFAPRPGGARLTFEIDFEFTSRLLDRLLALNFHRAVTKLVDCFEARAKTLYAERRSVRRQHRPERARDAARLRVSRRASSPAPRSNQPASSPPGGKLRASRRSSRRDLNSKSISKVSRAPPGRGAKRQRFSSRRNGPRAGRRR